MLLDFEQHGLVLFLNCIDFRVQRINIVRKSVVLIFSFNECSNNFISRCNTCLLFNLSERIFNNTYVSNVNIHQVFLFFIFSYMFSKSNFQNLNWVRKFNSCTFIFLRVLISVYFCSTKLSFVFFSELILHEFNSFFKISFFSFMLSFDS